jgi:polyhydroxyalkanoate synthesis regulator phasin
MAERGNNPLRELAERALGGGEEARELAEELAARWRGETIRLGERTGAGLNKLFRDLGLVTREELEELELRVAQLEHRLRLLER